MINFKKELPHYSARTLKYIFHIYNILFFKLLPINFIFSLLRHLFRFLHLVQLGKFH